MSFFPRDEVAVESDVVALAAFAGFGPILLPGRIPVVQDQNPAWRNLQPYSTASSALVGCCFCFYALLVLDLTATRRQT